MMNKDVIINNFLLFGYSDYEACGGMNDCLGDFATLEEAKEYVTKEREEARYPHDNYHVYDIKEKEMVPYA